MKPFVRHLLRLLLWGICLLVVAFFCMVMFGPRFFSLGWKLLSGWWFFLQRNVPSVMVNWILVATGLLVSVGVLVLAHWFFKTIYHQAQVMRNPGQSPRPWRWVWSLSIYFGTWLLFAVAFGASGIFRHTSWLFEHKEPWYQARTSRYIEIRDASLRIRMLMNEKDDDLEETRTDLLANKFDPPLRKPLWERYNVVFYSDRSGKIVAFVIIPREKNPKEEWFAIYDSRAMLQDTMPIVKLDATMAELSRKYPR